MHDSQASVRLRPMTASDLPLVLKWRNDESIRRYMFSTHVISEVESARWFERESADPRTHLLIFEQGGMSSGYVKLHMHGSGRTADWGFYASPKTPRGTGKALGMCALDHAFHLLALHKVCGQALGFNSASIGLHDKLGFQREGVLRDQHFDGRSYHDVVCFGLLESEWRLQRNFARG
jgi:UDP-4-amino-4,6-dideoxy-N-acetyl-beta-L-altrosamine N-acetyltransferase